MLASCLWMVLASNGRSQTGKRKQHRAGLRSSPPASGPGSAVSVCPSFSATCTQPCIAAAEESPWLLGSWSSALGLHQPSARSEVDGRGRKRSWRHPEPRPFTGGFPNPAPKATQGGWEVPLYRCNLLKQSNPYFLLVLERNSLCRCFRIHHLYSCVLQSSSGQTDRYLFGRVMPAMRSWADVIENCHPRFGGVSFFPTSFFHASTPQMEEGNEHSQTFGTASLLWLKVENIGCQIFYCSVN